MSDENSLDSIAERISARSNPLAEHPDAEAERNALDVKPESVEIEAQEPAEKTEAQSEPEVVEVEISDIAALAEHHGYDVADLYNIDVPYTKNGQRHAFTLGEIKDKLPEFEETLSMRTQLEEKLAQAQEAESGMKERLERDVQQFTAFMREAEQTLLADMQSVNWEQLRQENPGQWAAMSEQYRQKAMRLQDMHRRATEEIKKRQGEVEETTKANRVKKLEREQQLLTRAIPEWRNQDTAKAEMPLVGQYMREAGYTEDEVNNIDDHRLVALARKAMQMDKRLKDADVTQKKVVKLAKKIVKPGQRQTERETQHDRERSLVSAHRKNPKSMDAAAARIALRNS